MLLMPPDTFSEPFPVLLDPLWDVGTRTARVIQDAAQYNFINNNDIKMFLFCSLFSS